jgi:hypothetical protein
MGDVEAFRQLRVVGTLDAMIGPQNLVLPFSAAIRLESREIDPTAMAVDRGTGGALAIEGCSLRRHDGPPIRVGS